MEPPSAAVASPEVAQDEQEDEKLEVLEARIILPAVRAIFRNVAETMNALEFVNRRSEIEALVGQRITAHDRISVGGKPVRVRIAPPPPRISRRR